MKFEKMIYGMFDSIWDCEIDHPVFQDTVGELMEAVIQAYHVALKSETIHCEDCKHFIREDVEEYTPYGYNTHFHAFCDKHWDGEQGEYIDVKLDDFCSFAERRED